MLNAKKALFKWKKNYVRDSNETAAYEQRKKKWDKMIIK